MAEAGKEVVLRLFYLDWVVSLWWLSIFRMLPTVLISRILNIGLKLLSSHFALKIEIAKFSTLLAYQITTIWYHHPNYKYDWERIFVNHRPTNHWFVQKFPLPNRLNIALGMFSHIPSALLNPVSYRILIGSRNKLKLGIILYLLLYYKEQHWYTAVFVLNLVHTWPKIEVNISFILP